MSASAIPFSHSAQERQAALVLWMGTGLFAAAAFGLSCWRWWTFQYQTFDLAFYVQALWCALRGKWVVSLLGVPLLGNHAEPIVYGFLPLFAVCPHPMLLPALQVAAVATMAFTGRRIARRLGLGEPAAAILGLATLLAPASGYLAAHEFHPEALSAPLLLLLYEARQTGRWRGYALWFLLALACKENIALLLAGWCAVHAWLDRARGSAWQWRWNLLPGLLAAGWLALYAGLLSRHLNGGRVDYGNLYSSLGSSAGDAVVKFFTEPHLFWGALWRGASQGDLLWGMLASSAGLALLRPRWLLIATPILLQHLLSWRTSEWSLDFHYAAPLVPLFWLASAEAAARWRWKEVLAFAPTVACVILQPLIGPIREIAPECVSAERLLWNRAWKAPLVEAIAADPSVSVVAGMPYLSHLAKRPELHSLHLVLKGLQTLSLQPYEPDYRPDVVFVDFADQTTFNKPGGYYHPPGNINGRPLPSSDELLSRFLGRERWQTRSINAVTVFRRDDAASPVAARAGSDVQILPGATLQSFALVQPDPRGRPALEMQWRVQPPRSTVPWVKLRLTGATVAFETVLGMCAPQAADGVAVERREIWLPPWAPSGRFQVTAEFYDEIRVLWGKGARDPKLGEVKLGAFELR